MFFSVYFVNHLSTIRSPDPPLPSYHRSSSPYDQTILTPPLLNNTIIRFKLDLFISSPPMTPCLPFTYAPHIHLIIIISAYRPPNITLPHNPCTSTIQHYTPQRQRRQQLKFLPATANPCSGGSPISITCTSDVNQATNLLYTIRCLTSQNNLFSPPSP